MVLKMACVVRAGPWSWLINAPPPPGEGVGDLPPRGHAAPSGATAATAVALIRHLRGSVGTLGNAAASRA